MHHACLGALGAKVGATKVGGLAGGAGGCGRKLEGIASMMSSLTFEIKVRCLKNLAWREQGRTKTLKSTQVIRGNVRAVHINTVPTARTQPQKNILPNV